MNNTIEGVETMENNKIYTFRKLEAGDTFLMFRIIGKIGVNEFSACFDKDSVKALFNTADGEKNATMMGISVILEVANVVIGNLPKCETEIYEMLANTSNLTVEEIKALDFSTFAEMVIDFIRKDEFKDFIKVVSKSFKLGN